MKSFKPIIDEIDRVLVRHHRFTEEELDFIVNYDIKYRMGGTAERRKGNEATGTRRSGKESQEREPDDMEAETGRGTTAYFTRLAKGRVRNVFTQYLPEDRFQCC